jgi:hypothetical protein
MAMYYVSKTAETNGDHEVHRESCLRMLDISDRIQLGIFGNCFDALKAAKKHYPQVNGCYYCSEACSTHNVRRP